MLCRVPDLAQPSHRFGVWTGDSRYPEEEMTDIARVGIVDDHPAILMGTAAIVNAHQGLRMVAAAGTVEGLIKANVAVEVVLLDLSLADGSTPTDNVRRLSEAGLRTIAFTVGNNPHLIREASKAGALGMIKKSEHPTRLIAAILGALRGETVASSDWAAALDADPELASASLSPREAEVLTLYASGETAEQVAGLLYISRETVLDHIKRIRMKYALVHREAPTKVDLYRRAIEDGLVQPKE